MLIEAGQMYGVDDGLDVVDERGDQRRFEGRCRDSVLPGLRPAHKWSNVRQLDAVSRSLLSRLWAAGAGPADLVAPLTIDLDSTIVAVQGRKKQGAAFGYTKVREAAPRRVLRSSHVLLSCSP